MENCKDCETWRMAAEMISFDDAFYSNWDEKGKDAGLSFCIIMNDVWAWASADAEVVAFKDIPILFSLK